jgi:hypothetical protein
MAEKSREDEKAKVNESDDHSRIEASPQDQQWNPNDESRKRYFDVNSIVDKTSQAHLNGSIEFERLSEALGTRDTDFVWGLTTQIIDAVADHQSGEAIGFVLSVIRDQRPRDHFERMVVTNAAVAYLKSMSFATEVSPSTMLNIPRSEFALKASASFGRLFASYMATLKQHRSGGEQRVTVRHVSVSDGAQAIVGNVTNQRVIEDSPDASPMLTDARQEAMEPVPKRDPLRVRLKRSNG